MARETVAPARRAAVPARLELSRALVLVVLLAALALRMHDLGAQSFWYDEGTSATVAPRAVRTILADAAGDIHPPLYYLLLHAWVFATGSGEVVLRFPSAVVGVLTVAWLYRLGRDVGGGGGGLAAAALLAAAPLPIWYSQEARMYALATGLGAAATAVLLRALARSSRGLWIGYGVLVAATLYTHYFAATVPLAHGVALVLARRLPLGFLVAGTAAGLSFLPWVARTYGQLAGWPATSQPFTLPELVSRTLGLFALGQGGDRADALVGLPLLVAAAIGVVALRRSTRWLLAAYAVVPLGAMFAVSLRRPFFHPKFVLLVAPAVDLLAGLGITVLVLWLGRRSRVAGVALGVVLVAGLIGWRWPGVAAQWNDPRLARDDYRGLAAHVAREAQPGDGVVLDAPGQVEIFHYYYPGDLPRFPLPADRPMDEAKTARALDEIAARQTRVWLVLWAVPESDPTGFVERWMDERMYKASNQWYGGVRLALYVNPALANLPTTSFSPRARFGDVAELSRAEMVAPQLRAGDVVPVTLRWRALRPTDVRYTVFVHLIGAGEYLWGQRDSEPVGGGRPTTTWHSGEQIVDRPGVGVLPGTPPGDYQLEIGLYDGKTGQRLPVADAEGRPIGDRLMVGPFAVLPGRAGAEARPKHPATASFASERLLGFDLGPLGRDDAPPEVARGELALLTLYWRAGEKPDTAPARLAIRLIRGGAPPVERGFDFTQGRYPVDRWTPGELVRDPYKLTTDDLPPGTYALALQLRDERDRPLGSYAPLGDLVVR